ncbi:hypothetical protein [Stenotrophomonas rhizophila]|uniref:Uncharacterized protein n=1 Tax=Stenotrophomonas rhizophila TaxID=216778 RepID=A0A498CRJ9_9GAMM|nr:hypothetical protein [Stenotrophomonas rhizophila]RLK57874.1 hypothetical protein BCL79_2288 [Stenotrophomonas rhizophila]
MTRSLLDASAVPPPLPAQDALPPPLNNAAVAAPPITVAAPDALAGALPGWDLLPKTGFVRRKRASHG